MATARSDIVLQNDSGLVADWLMKGNQIIGSGNIGNPGLSWHVVGMGDFNGDGKSDILLQDVSGQIREWLMNARTDHRNQ